MSKGKGPKFTNRAARKFAEMNKVDTLSQEEVYKILGEDIKTMLDQVTAFRQHKPGAVPPNYIGNAFANISTSLFFYEFVKEHVKIKIKKGKLKKFKHDFDKDELESLRSIIADAYKKSVSNVYVNQVQEHNDRNKLLTKTFAMLDPKTFLRTRKLKGLTKAQCRELAVQVYGDPIYNFRFIHKMFNLVTEVSDKKKIRILKELYGKRFVRAMGAAMTVENNQSDILGAIFNFIDRKKKMKRAKYLRAYAEAYKRTKTHYFQINQDFYDRNKPIIKELKVVDLGYKKAFKGLKSKKLPKDGLKTKRKGII